MIYLDFETQSEVNIKNCGSYRYVEGIYFKPVCMAYAYDDDEPQLWLPGQPLPKGIATGSDLVIHNAEFEYNVFHSDWFKWHEYDVSSITYDRIIDTQALAATFGFPIALADLCKALRVEQQKDAAGTRLINKLCVVKNGKVPKPTHKKYAQDFKRLYEYCKQDVRAMRDCYKYMIKKKLSAFEMKVYLHTMKQNRRGLPIDRTSVEQILHVLNVFKDQCNTRLSDITNGVVTSGTQTQRIVQYISGKGFPIQNLQAPYVEDLLSKEVLDKHCEEILQIRQKTSRSSTAKFEKALNMMNKDDRVQGQLKYHKSHTGRFAGRGFQIHNLPRAQHDNPDEVISDFFNMPIPALISKYGNIGEAASKLIRPIVKAPKGKKLCVADFKSVENVCLHWLANDLQTTEDFWKGVDQYKRYASRRFNVAYEDVTKEQRTYAKPCVLGLGYGGGAGALQYVAKGYGINLEWDQAEADKKFYRNMYPQIPKLWYQVSDAMIKAVYDETLVELYTGVATVRFIKRGTYAFILLPSGRFLSYPAPLIQTDAQYGNACFTYMGLDPYTKQWRRLGDQNKRDPDMVVHGGRLVENIIQAIARDLLVYGLLNLEEAGYKIIGSVHDEAIAEIDDEIATDSTLKKFCKTMCILPAWANGLPLMADGYIATRYRKD